MLKKIRFYIVVLILLVFSCSTTVLAKSKYVASVEGKSYTSMQKAINSAKSGQTITLLSNVTTNKTVIVKKGKGSININFAGNKYVYTGKKSAFDIKSGSVQVRGLKVQSKNYIFSVFASAKVIILNGSADGYILNKGTLEIKGGKFTTNKSDRTKNDELIQNKGNLTIDNGDFYGTSDNALYSTKGKVLINGGSFKCNAINKNGYTPTIVNMKKSSITLKKGTFRGKGSAFYNEGKAHIVGGKYYASTANDSQVDTYVCVYNNKGKMEIDGGNINIQNKKQYSVGNWKGNVTINKGTIKGCVANYTNGKKSLIINGGNITGKNGYLALNNINGKVVINGGIFRSKKDSTVYNQKGNIVISGGKFSTSNYNAIFNGKRASIRINDGYFSSTKGYYALWNEGSATLSGGIFKTTGGNGHSIGSYKGSTIKKSGNVKGKVDYK